MAALPVILLVAGTAMQAVGEIKEGRAMSQAELYNASVAQSQAQAAKVAGEFERATITQAGATEQRQLEREKKQTASTQKARYGAAGVRRIGSPIEVMADTAAQFELDLAASRYNVQLGVTQSKYEQDVATRYYTSEAQYRRQMAKYQKRAGYLRAGSTILTAAGSYGVMSGFGGGTPAWGKPGRPIGPRMATGKF